MEEWRWTSDVVSFPPGSSLNGFDWRISIAQIEVDGPFSIFEGVQRHMIVVAGSLRLHGAGIEHTLSAGDGAFSFSGEVPVHGSRVGGSVRDLNLMVRAERFVGRLRVVEPSTWRSNEAATVVVAPINLSITVDEHRFELAPEDALHLPKHAIVASPSPLIIAEARELA